MKRSLIAVSLALFAATVFAGNSQYNNEAGEMDLHTPIADAGKSGNDAEQSFPQLG